MKLAVSNIAWTPDVEPDAAALLQSLGVLGVEIAPTTVWPVPLKASTSDIARYRTFWESRDIRIIGLQALLYGRQDLSIFGPQDGRRQAQAYLAGMIDLCAQLGGHVLVFGSPRNRSRGTLTVDDARSLAVDFFGPLARQAEAAHVTFCIEPNPPEYGCDFVTSSREGIDLVRHVGSAGFGLHLDAGGMTMTEEPIDDALEAAVPWCRHFHISEPQLQPVGTGASDHRSFGAALRSLHYRHWVSIEMRSRGRDDCLADLRIAVRHARESVRGPVSRVSPARTSREARVASSRALQWALILVAILLIVAGLLLPRDWYDPLTRKPGLPEPPVRGVTLLQASLVLDGLFLLVYAGRGRRMRVHRHIEPVNSANAADSDALVISPGLAGAVLAAVTAAGVGLRVWGLESDLWLDEITPIQEYGSMPFLEVIATYYASNNHLLNTLLGKLTMAWFGESEWSVRLPAVVFGATTVPLLYWVARIASTRTVSLGAALLLAGSYHHIFFSQNARGYAGHVMLSILGSGLFVRGLQRDRPILWIGYIAVMVLNVATLLLGAVVVVAHAVIACAVVGLQWRRQRFPADLARRLLIVFGMTALLIFHIYATALPQAYVYILTMYTTPSSGFPAFSREFWTEVVRGVAAGLPVQVVIAFVPALAVGVAGAVTMIRRAPILVGALALPVVLLALALAIGGLTFSPRFFLLALPVAFLIGVEGLQTIVTALAGRFDGNARSIAVATAMMVTVTAAAGLIPLRRYYEVPKQPYRAVINYTEAVRRPAGIVIAVHLAEKGYSYYATRQGLRVGEDFFLARTVETFEAVVRTHLGQSIYLVTTLPRFLHQEVPDLEARIERDWVVDREFPATIGDGAISVWKPAKRSGLDIPAMPLAGLTEDYRVADSNWVRVLRPCIDGPADVVGGTMDNARRGRCVDWGAFFAEYGFFSATVTPDNPAR